MPAGKSRKTRISTLDVLFLLLAMVIAGLGAYLLVGSERRPSPTEVMEQRLRNLSRLTTISQTYRSVIYVQEKNFWRGDKEVLFSLKYQVTAGVDFTRGVLVPPNGRDSATVRMPPAEIFTSDADESTIHQMFLREQAFLNPVRMGDYMPQVIAQGEANRQSAIDGGILERSEANARKAVTRVMKLGGFEEVMFGPALMGEPVNIEPGDGNG